MSRLRAIILNYNRASLTASCVASVLSQDHRPLDVVVVDNHSEEGEYARLSESLSPDVKVVRCQENLGYAAGNNRGIAFEGFPSPEYVAIINNDVLFPDSRILSKLVRALKSDPRRAACSPLVDTLPAGTPPQTQIQVRRIPGYFTLLVADSWWLRRLPGLRKLGDSYLYADHRPYPSDSEIECETINGSCWVVRKDVLDQIGNLDTGTFLYQEEIIFGKQVQELGKTNCLVTSSIVHHYHGGTSGQRAGRVVLKSFLQMARSEAYYCRKYLGISHLKLASLYVIRAIDISTKIAFSTIRSLVT